MTGQMIREFREREGLSQTALGQRLGVTQAAVSQWEANKVSWSHVGKLARMMGVDPKVLRPDLFGEASNG